MECPKCQHDNPPAAKFCLECGAKLEAVCPACGEALPPTAKCCLECGHDLSQLGTPSDSPSAETSAPTGERRQATVLFSDLSGYTAMNERLDPEVVEGIITIGEVPPEAIEQAKELFGFENAILEPKAFV